MKNTTSILLGLLALILMVVIPCPELGAMVFKPETGSMWDPTILWHDGQYYAYMMYDTEGDDAFCLLATSPDGVHWQDQGKIISEHDRTDGASFFKCFVVKAGDRFIMDHGVGHFEGKHQLPQDTMRFFQSKDLRHWEYITSTHPDDRWYRQDRWDHMYMLPKAEGHPEAGYWGYVVAVPKEGMDLPAMMESKDGLKWDVLPPAKTEWGDVTPRNHFEYGGCERIGGKYYLLGGASGYNGHKGYATYTLIGDGPRGPFHPDAEAYRLCGNTGEHLTWLASWVRAKDELLIANYSLLQHGQPGPCMLPLRKPIIDQAGHLRLGWWKGNEALKAGRLQPRQQNFELDGAGKPNGGELRYLVDSFDLDQGIIMEGRITAHALTKGDPAAARPVAGFVFEEKPGQAMSVQLGVGPAKDRETHIGRLTTGTDGGMVFSSEDVTGRNCATVTGLDDGREHTFRLLCRWELIELYIDDLLMQTYTHEKGSGRVGFLVGNAKADFSNVSVWAMSLTKLKQDRSIPINLAHP
ncbi:MAG: hypothetical protein PSU94_02005 [Lacunisphaera sp.]|nr:hypothetical protein [Lacunisphaera sp.]